MSLKNKFPAEEFVPATIRCADKLGENLEVRLPNFHRVAGCVAVLQHEKVTEERLRACEIGMFSIRGPEVESASHRLFGSIVEVVAEGWPNLRLRFNGKKQRVVADNEQVPFLGRSEKTRKLNIIVPINTRRGNPGRDDKIREEVDEPIHVRSAGHGAGLIDQDRVAGRARGHRRPRRVGRVRHAGGDRLGRQRNRRTAPCAL